MITKELIATSFTEDSNIFNFCNPDYANSSIDELVNSVYKTIAEYKNNHNNNWWEVVVKYKGEQIGFIFGIKNPNRLVSFGIHPNFRTAIVLYEVFEQVKGKFYKQDFETYMWERNSRAINWLKKCGMKEVYCDVYNVRKLMYKCQ